MSFTVMLQQLSNGMVKSIGIFVLTLIFSLPLGLLISFGRMSKNKILQTIMKVYISIMRGTPLMLQLLVVYFGPFYLFGMKIGGSYRYMAIIIGFALNYAAYFCEIFRAGIQAIPKGQYEAAHTLGMNYVQTMRRIVLPQVIRIILPPISNETITLVKDTSLVYVLAMNDLMRTARNLVQRDFNITPFIVAGCFYLFATLILTVIFERLEKHFSKYDQ